MPDDIPPPKPLAPPPNPLGYRFCPRCGGPLTGRVLKEGEPERLVCVLCEFVLWLEPKIAAGTLFEYDGGLVLVKRAIEPAYGKWTYPGGFVERGERVIDAAIRETKEECVVDVEAHSLLNIYSYTGRPSVIAVYAADIVSGQPQVGDETLEIGIFTQSDIPWDDLAFDSTREAVRDFVERFMNGKR